MTSKLNMTPPSLFAVAFVIAALGGCSSFGAPSSLPEDLEPPLPDRCSTAVANPKPFVVDWDATDRGMLEAIVRRGAVAVYREGCQVEVVDGCQVASRYRYTPLTPKRDAVHIRDADALFAAVPVGAWGLRGRLSNEREVAIDRTMVGRFELTRGPIMRSELADSCGRATHVITGFTVGAFRFLAGSERDIEVALRLPYVESGAQTAASFETLSVDGDVWQCEQASGSDSEPPFGCGALIQLELGLIRPEAECERGQTETCNGADDDCDGLVDEGCPKDVAPSPVGETATVGGTGGQAFARDCPPGQVVRGLYGTSGVYVYELGVICGAVALDATDGGEPFTMRIGDGATLPALGGNVLGDKRPWRFTCPDGTAVSGLSGRAGDFVDQLAVTCARPRIVKEADTHRVRREPGAVSGPLGGGQGGDPFALACDGDGWFSGLRGRAGAWLDAIGGSCAKLMVLDGSAPTPHAAGSVAATTVGAELGCPAGQILVDQRCYPEKARAAIDAFRLAWPDGATRAWRGTWTKGTWRFSFDLDLTRNGTSLDGTFHWRLAAAPPDSHLAGSEGATGQEMVRGTVDLATGLIDVTGYGVSNPGLLSPDRYDLKLTPGGSLVGSTRTFEGSWGAVLVADPR